MGAALAGGVPYEEAARMAFIPRRLAGSASVNGAIRLAAKRHHGFELITAMQSSAVVVGKLIGSARISTQAAAEKAAERCRTR